MQRKLSSRAEEGENNSEDSLPLVTFAELAIPRLLEREGPLSEEAQALVEDQQSPMEMWRKENATRKEDEQSLMEMWRKENASRKEDEQSLMKMWRKENATRNKECHQGR